MVKVNGPMMSLDASGKLGDALVFSKWKGRNYVRSLVTPANPKSGGQVGVRAMLKWLSQHWTDVSAGDQATWETRAEAASISAFNAYMKVNQARWRNFLAPGEADPVGESDTAGVCANETATAGVRQITLEIDITTANQNCGIMVFRDTSTGFSTAFDNLIGIVKADSVAADFTWVDTPLAAGTYYYNFRPFTDDGVLGAEVGEVNATVT